MVNLGLTQDLDSCPSLFPRLGFTLPANEDVRGPLLKSWPSQHSRAWELFFPIQKNLDHAAWVLELSACIRGLGQTRWCIKTHDLVQVFNLPLDKSLARWGELFWPNFRLDSVFVFTAGEDENLVREVLEMWHRRETNICLRSRYDFTVQDTKAPVHPPKQKRYWSLWSKFGFKYCN